MSFTESYLISLNIVDVAWGGGEHGKTEYEVLVGSGGWVPGNGSNIPPNALPCEFNVKTSSFSNLIFV